MLSGGHFDIGKDYIYLLQIRVRHTLYFNLIAVVMTRWKKDRPIQSPYASSDVFADTFAKQYG